MTASCEKKREGDERIIKIAEGEEHIEGNDALIVDDLIQT